MANQTSCYGVVEKPGTAFDYNDWHMALFWDALFTRVYGVAPEVVDEKVLRPLLTDRIGCQDEPTLLAFGAEDRAGRMAISPRDFARFGQLFLHQGTWEGDELLKPELIRRLVSEPLPADLPRAGQEAAAMLEGQRSIGSRQIPDNQCEHEGSYSWLWWINGVNREGECRWPDVPVDVFSALGHRNGMRGMAVLPSQDMVVSWNDSRIEELPEEPHPLNEMLRLLVASLSD
jgi:CubicO group peptidase (beta-lactamase class C family)